MITITANAMASGRIPILDNLAIRNGRVWLVAPANSRVAKNATKVTANAILMMELIPRAATSVTVVTVVIIFCTSIYRNQNVTQGNTFVNRNKENSQDVLDVNL
ncbi:hypothetical protein ACFLUP_00320 [Chloroflexota bacterium]